MNILKRIINSVFFLISLTVTLLVYGDGFKELLLFWPNILGTYGCLAIVSYILTGKFTVWHVIEKTITSREVQQ